MPYITQTFDVVTFDQAKNVVLSTDPNDPEKFDRETDFLIDAIFSQNIIHSGSTVLDYGCGMGRVSRELVRRFDCRVIGVDISDSMLTFAKLYVANMRRFETCKLYDRPDTIDVCVSSFVLQHVEDPIEEIQRIHRSLKIGGYLVLLNEPKRWVPVDIDRQNLVVWNDDGVDIIDEVSKRFKKVASVQYMKGPLEIGFYERELTEGDKQAQAWLKNEYYDLED
jgi:SAM-dependent methyltransferase